MGIEPATFLSLGRRVLDACEGIKFGGETVTSSSRQLANCCVAVTDTTADGNALNLTLKHIVCLVFLSSPWNSEKHNSDDLVRLVHVEKLANQYNSSEVIF